MDEVCPGSAHDADYRANPREKKNQIETSSNTSTRMKQEEFHIGNVIKAVLKEQERSEAWLARKVHCDPGNFNRILKRNSMDLDLLKRISISMNHNFVAEYAVYVEQQIHNENQKPDDFDN